MGGDKTIPANNAIDEAGSHQTDHFKKVVLEKKFIVSEKDIDTLYISSLNWLKKINSKILVENKPLNILAHHEKIIVIRNPENIDSILGNWNPFYWKKQIEIINEVINDKIVLKIKLISYNNLYLDIKKRWWNELIEKYVNYIGINLDKELLRELYPKEDMIKMTHDLLYTSLPQIFISIIGILIGFIFLKFKILFFIIILLSIYQLLPIILQIVMIRSRIRNIY